MSGEPPVNLPGINVEELPSGGPAISGSPTSITAFVGRASRGPVDEPTAVGSFADYVLIYGGLASESAMSFAVRDFFANGGNQARAVILRVAHASASRGRGGEEPLDQEDLIGADKRAGKRGLYALDKADGFGLLCIPPYNGSDVDRAVVASAAEYCEQRRAMLLVDAPKAWTSARQAARGMTTGPGLGTRSANAMVYWPRLVQRNPLRGGQMASFVPCGAVAGVIARTDGERGVWVAPAGPDARLVDVAGLSAAPSDAESGKLGALGINCLRTLPGVGHAVWGARTLQGADAHSSEWKYVSVRRLALFLEESLFQGLDWVVFEPNDEPLWAQIRTCVGAFMEGLYRRGAFQGASPGEAFFVRCDSTTMAQADVNEGIVSLVVGFAPLRPAEFVILRIKLAAGQA
jgi:phage tail sheath protein FI